MLKLKNWFSNLKVSEKLALISIFFVMPDSVMLYLFITGINANIQFADLEKMGNAYQRPLETLLQVIPEHEQLAEQALLQPEAFRERLAAKEAAVERAFDELERVDSEIGINLQFTDEGLAKRKREHDRPHLVRKDWSELKAERATLDQPTLAQKHAAIIASVRTMITHAGDMSNLILDPDLDSYYLMDATLLALPQAQERLSTVTAFGRRALLGDLSADDRQQLAIHARLLREADLERITGSIQTALNEDANFYGQSESLQRQ